MGQRERATPYPTRVGRGRTARIPEPVQTPPQRAPDTAKSVDTEAEDIKQYESNAYNKLMERQRGYRH